MQGRRQEGLEGDAAVALAELCLQQTLYSYISLIAFR